MKILCYIYEGMADFEITLLLHRLRGTGKREIVTISENTEPLLAQSGLTYLPAEKIGEISNIEEYEALIIPGGPINNEQNAICRIVQEMVAEGKLVAAICFAPQFLGRAGVLREYAYTTSCSVEKIEQLGIEDPMPRENYREERMVWDRNVITAKGYAFVDFAMAVCDYLGIYKDEKTRYEQLGRIKE